MGGGTLFITTATGGRHRGRRPYNHCSFGQARFARFVFCFLGLVALVDEVLELAQLAIGLREDVVVDGNESLHGAAWVVE